MPRVTFLVLAFNADAFLEPVLESILPFGEVRVVEGPVAYFARAGYQTSTDRTNEILHDLVGANNVVHGTWSEKDEMMNAARIPAGTEFVWMVDADEVWEPHVLARVLAHLDEYDSVSFKPWTFFGGFERVLTGFELRAEWIRLQRWHERAQWRTHRPPTVLDPQGRPYRQARHLESPEHFFHYSYVMPSAVRAKVAYYDSWGAGVIPQWFDSVYLPWVCADWHTRQDIERASRSSNPLRQAEVVLFCAGMTTKVLMWELYPLLSRERMTLLDLGSVLDMYCGVDSRKYARQMPAAQKETLRRLNFRPPDLVTQSDGHAHTNS